MSPSNFFRTTDKGALAEIDYLQAESSVTMKTIWFNSNFVLVLIGL